MKTHSSTCQPFKVIWWSGLAKCAVSINVMESSSTVKLKHGSVTLYRYIDCLIVCVFRFVCIGRFKPWEGSGKASERLSSWTLPYHIQQGALPGIPPQSGRGSDEGEQGNGWVCWLICWVCWFFTRFVSPDTLLAWCPCLNVIVSCVSDAVNSLLTKSSMVNNKKRRQSYRLSICLALTRSHLYILNHMGWDGIRFHHS